MKTRKLIAVLASLIMALALFAIPSFAITPVDPGDSEILMYANDFSSGDPVAVRVDPYGGWLNGNIYGHEERLDPDNVLGLFDAVTTTGINEYFFGCASREWTNYTFEDNFCNVEDYPDVKFREVTWGTLGSWHAEAVLVFLTDCYVRDSDGQVVPYTPTDDEGDFGYFAGIAGNKEAIAGFAPEEKQAIREYYADQFNVSDRQFYSSTYQMDPAPNNTRATTHFYFPDEVVYAGGITLVDITDYVYNYNTEVGSPNTYLNVAGVGREITFLAKEEYPGDALMGDKITVTYARNPDTNALLDRPGNTDGFDLDAIQVYRYNPWRSGDSATGNGQKILPKGTWFMYNLYDIYQVAPDTNVYDIQAGNPKDGILTIGTFTVNNNGDGTFTVTYDIDDTVEWNGYAYDIDITSECLSVCDDMPLMFTAKPGVDDNQDFGVPFTNPDTNGDGKFCIFAHFSVEYH